MTSPGALVLVACYELGHQPLTLASPLATLRRAGFAPVVVDTSVDTLTDDTIDAARLVAISVPMHTALRLGVRVAERVRARNPQAIICFYGLYAALNSDYLLRYHADATIGGEYEEALLALAEALMASDPPGAISASGGTGDRRAILPHIAGVSTREWAAGPVLARLPFAAPARETLAAPQHYAHLVNGERVVPAGYVEATRGCLHTCLHCPITPVYGGRFFVVPREVVLADIRAQVAAGVEHITFGDPDFFNGPVHAMRIVRALHEEWPHVTFDATIKVEHLLERRELLPELAALGCAFVVAAVESVGDNVLRHLAKGHTRADITAALAALDAAGLPMRPTFVAFTPWTTAHDYRDMLDFIAAHDLIEAVDPVQYTIRLLVPPGSALLGEAETAAWIGPLDEANFRYQWAHPDPRMDRLHEGVSALVERALAAGESAEAIFYAVCRLTEQMVGLPVEAGLVAVGAGRDGAPRRARRPIPHLSEPWFC